MLFLYGLLTGAFIGTICTAFLASLCYEEQEAGHQRLLDRREKHIWQ